MNFDRLAFAQQVLRAMTGQRVEKTAGLLGGLARGAGRVGSWAVQHPMPAVGMALGGLGLYQVGKASVQKAKAYNAGFHPAVQQQLATPLGQ